MLSGSHVHGSTTSVTNTSCVDYESPQLEKKSRIDKHRLSPLPAAHLTPYPDEYQQVSGKQLQSPRNTTPSPPSRNDAKVERSPIPQLFRDRPVEATPVRDGERADEINTTIKEIVRLYAPIEDCKQTIKACGDEFMTSLGLDEDASFADCLKRLREGAGELADIDLVCDGAEPLRLKVNQLKTESTMSLATRRAVNQINTALNQCQKFKGEKELRLADIQYKLDELQLLPLTKEGVTVYQNLSKIIDYIEELSSDIDNLLKEVFQAYSSLYMVHE